MPLPRRKPANAALADRGIDLLTSASIRLGSLLYRSSVSVSRWPRRNALFRLAAVQVLGSVRPLGAWVSNVTMDVLDR